MSQVNEKKTYNALLKMAVWFLLFVSGALLQYGLVFAIIDRREYGIIRHRVLRVIHLNIILCRFHLSEAETKLPPFLQTTFSNEFFEWKSWIALTISLKFVPHVRINNIPTLVQIMACRLVGQWWSIYWSTYASLGLRITIRIRNR